MLDAVENPVDIDPSCAMRAAHTLINAAGGANLAVQVITLAMRRRENSEATRLIRAVFRAVPAIPEALPAVSLADDDTLKMIVALLLHADADALKTVVIDAYAKGECWCNLRRLDAYKLDYFFALWFEKCTGEPGQMSRVIAVLGAQKWYTRRGSIKNGVRCVKIWRRIANRLSMPLRDMHVHPSDPRFKMAWQAITEALDFCPLKTLPLPADIFAENADQAAAYILLNPPGSEFVRTSMDCLRKLGNVGDLTNIIPTQWAKTTWNLAQDIIPQSPGPCFRVQPTWTISQVKDCSDYFFALLHEDIKKGQLLAEPYDLSTRSQERLRQHSDAFEFVLHLMRVYPDRFPRQLTYAKQNHLNDTILCLATGIFRTQASAFDKIRLFLEAARRFKRFSALAKEIEAPDAALFGINTRRTVMNELVVYYVKPESLASRCNVCPGDKIEMVRVFPEDKYITDTQGMIEALAKHGRVDVMLSRRRDASIFEEIWDDDFEHWRTFGPYNRGTELGTVHYRFWSSQTMQTLFQILRFVVLTFSRGPLLVVLNNNVPDTRKRMIVELHNLFPDIGNYGGSYPLTDRYLYTAYKAAQSKSWVESDYVSRFIHPTCRLFAKKNRNEARARFRVCCERNGILAFLCACKRLSMPVDMAHHVLLFTL